MDNMPLKEKMLLNFLVYLLMKTSHGNSTYTMLAQKISKSIGGVLCKSRGIVKQPLLKYLYFFYSLSFELCKYYRRTSEGLYHHQKHAARIINFKDRFTHAQPLLHEMKSPDHLSNKFISHNLFHVQMQKEDSSSYFP